MLLLKIYLSLTNYIYMYVLNYLLLLPQRRLTFITYLIKRITINIIKDFSSNQDCIKSVS